VSCCAQPDDADGGCDLRLVVVGSSGVERSFCTKKRR